MKKNIFENFKYHGSLDFSEEYEVSPDLVEHKDVLEENKEEKPFYKYFYLIAVVFFLLLFFKLMNIQITNGYQNRFLADDNRIRPKLLEPPRGSISDSQGVPLVNNIPSYRLDIYPADLPKKSIEKKQLYKKVSPIIGVSVEDISKTLSQQSFASLNGVTIKENIERETALALEVQLNDYPSFQIVKDTKRVYSPIAGLSHILGYIGKVSENDLELNKTGYSSTSKIGKAGLEKYYESTLRGKQGQEELEVDSQGRVQRTLSTSPATPGNNLVLSLDSRLQNAAVAAMQQAFVENKAEKGVAIAMNPKDGSILAYASLPAYDNNLFAKGITQSEYSALLQDKNRPLLDRISNGTYPSGSVIKPIVATAALEEKTITPSTRLDTSAGAIKIGQWIFPDWKVHGVTDVRQAVAESNDIFFYALGGGYLNVKGIGVDRIGEWLKKFGYGSPTGIDLPTESSGLVPNDTWKRKVKKEPWYIGDTYHMSIGQGFFLCTPLQMAVATSAIANNGEILKPHLLSRVVDNSGNILQKYDKEVVKSGVANSSNLQVVREGMRAAVTNGSAFKVRDLPFSVAAKTGTAQFGDNTFSHAWFTAFAPYENPEIVVVVMVESGGQGSMTSAPVARAILETYFANKK